MTDFQLKHAVFKRPVFSSALLLAVITCVTVFLLTRLIRTDSDDASDPVPVAISLADQFNPDNVEGSPTEAVIAPPRVEWRFDGSIPSPSAETNISTLGWQAAQDVHVLQVLDGRLVGRTTGEWPIISARRTVSLDVFDQMDAVEIRMRVSAGSNLGINGGDYDEFQPKQRITNPFPATTPIIADGQMRTYVITGDYPAETEEFQVRTLLIMPTDAKDAEFEIESIRMLFHREHLARIPSGTVWQHQSRVFRQTLVAKTPEVITFPVSLPDRPWLDLALGTVDENPLSFHINIANDDLSAENTSVYKHTISTPHTWEPLRVDLSKYADQDVMLSLSLADQTPGTLGLWGSPVIRNDRTYPVMPPNDNEARSIAPPQGVIVIWADMLRWDHLDVYGYHRETAPVITTMATEGTLFHDCLSQAPWTLPSTASLLTSLYPTTHEVVNMYEDSLSEAATTIAEVFRNAGYATLSFSSMHYTGSQYNLDQGFEELHESDSALQAREQSGHGTAREYVNQLLPWLQTHRDVPFFVFLHTYEPKGGPYPPYDTLWAEPTAKKKFQEYAEQIGFFPTAVQAREAGIDPHEFISLHKDSYDGMISVLNAEVGRLFEGLKEMGLHDNTLVIFASDHGQEYFDHGRIGHHGAYSEATHVPLIIRWPGVIPSGAQIHETVRIIDVMPTILELCRLPIPQQAQGQSLLPLIAERDHKSDQFDVTDDDNALFTTSQWKKEPAISESHPSAREHLRDENYRDSHAIILDGWKLIQFFPYGENIPDRIELYDHRNDVLDKVNLADKNPDIVENLLNEYKAWKQRASAARRKPELEQQQILDSETLKRLRSLGYVK